MKLRTQDVYSRNSLDAPNLLQSGPDFSTQQFVLKGVVKGWILILWQALAFSYCWWTMAQWEERNALSVWENPKCSHPEGWRSLLVPACGSGFCRIIPLKWQRGYEVLNTASSLPPAYWLGNTLYWGISGWLTEKMKPIKKKKVFSLFLP